MTGYLYMTASQKGGTIYIGVTNDLARWMPEHKSGQGSSFTSRYGVQRLVWYDFHITDAVQRETSLKRWLAPMEYRTHREDQPGMVRTVSRNWLVSVLHRCGA